MGFTVVKERERYRPLVSILINCHNGAKFLPEALGSVSRQNYTNWEIIFVDNCSTDTSAQIAKAFSGKLYYLKTAEKLPLYKARNIGLGMVSGKYLCFLDSDDYWEDDKLDWQVDQMEREPLAFIAAGWRILFEETGKKQYRSPCRSKKLSCRNMLKRYDIRIVSTIIRVSCLMGHQFNDKLTFFGDFVFFLSLMKVEGVVGQYEPRVAFTLRTHECSVTTTEPDLPQQERAILEKDLVPLLSKIERIRLADSLNLKEAKRELERKNYQLARRIAWPIVLRRRLALLVLIGTFFPRVIDIT